MNEIIFEGYLAELIALRAERLGMTPEAYVLSIFAKGCNAPEPGGDSFCDEVQCT
ncbi:MAG: hypothetical protein J6V72_21900 [Kiritimatiellae bacterium]|nr:hypothetical protein [Kiritimatiellia bacterium]